MAPHVPGKLYLEHGPPSSPGAELAPLAKALAMEIPRGTLSFWAVGHRARELGTLQKSCGPTSALSSFGTHGHGCWCIR